MFDKSIGERFAYLLERSNRSIDEVAQRTGINRAYLYELKKDQKTHPSAEVLEKLALFFNVSPLFFSRNELNYVPPVSPEEVHVALRAVGKLTEADQELLDRLIARAKELAASDSKAKSNPDARG